MPKSYIRKRVKFLNKIEQKKFIELVETRIGKGLKEVALISGVSRRQISDWKNGKTTLSLYAFEKLVSVSNIARPKNIKIIEQYAHAKSAGKKGFYATFKKYGKIPKNEEKRKTNWEEWWKAKGIYKKQKILERITVETPKRSKHLAELCGIIIGDGGITKKQLKITLNGETDKAYSRFVIKLLQKLFKIKPKVYKVKNTKALNICISRSNLVNFLVAQGMKLGHKINQNVSIPEWILNSREYLIACLRGMIDTDGSVVREIHNIKNKKYLYYRLNFTSACPLLIEQTYKSLKNLGFTPKIRRRSQSIQLENIDEIWEYFKRVGTSNPKHLKRLGKAR